MTVKELITRLEEFDDLEVVMAIDDEWNGFREIANDWVTKMVFNEHMDYYADEDLEDMEEDELNSLKEMIVIG